jgi:hypothetical protein
MSGADSGPSRGDGTFVADQSPGDTDDARIQAALDAASRAGGGRVVLAGRTYTITRTLVIPDRVSLAGTGAGQTVLLAAPGLNADLARSQGFETLRGSNQPAGPTGVLLTDLTLDGNQAANGQGNGLSKYGYTWRLVNVVVRNCAGDGLYSEWSTYGGVPVGGDGMEDQWVNVKVHDCGGNGVTFRGPHDSQWSNVIVYNIGGTGVRVEATSDYTGGGLAFTNLHIWQLFGAGDAFSTNTAVFGSSLYVEGAFQGNGLVLSGSGSRIDGLFSSLNKVGLVLSGPGNIVTAFDCELGDPSGHPQAGQTGVLVLANDQYLTGFVGGVVTGLQLGDAAHAVAGVMVDVHFLNCTGPALQYANPGNGNNTVRGYIWSAAGAFVAGSPPAATDSWDVTGSGPQSPFSLVTRPGGIAPGITTGAALPTSAPVGTLLTEPVAGRLYLCVAPGVWKSVTLS